MRRFVLLLLLVAPMVVPGAAPSLVLGGEEGEAEGEVADADFKASFDGESIRHPIWGITMRVPGVSRWEHPMADQPNFVLAAHSEQDDCSLNLSMFAIPIPLGITAAECRIHYPGNPDPLRGDPDVTLHLDEAAPVALTLFDLQLSSEGLTRNTLYGYWSYSSNCFELHISSIRCDSFSDLALPILRSVEILDQPDVTLETVIAGRSMGLDPKHWNVHMQIGGILLHQTDPPRTAQARRFYSNSRRLAGDSLPLWEEWLIEEGIGLSWLMEDNGVEAIPHLERSVQIGREHPDLIKGGEASLYNLACAQSLAGSQEQACAALEEFMGRKERKERKKALAEIRKDSQLKGARDSPCYGAVVALAKKKKGADQ